MRGRSEMIFIHSSHSRDDVCVYFVIITIIMMHTIINYYYLFIVTSSCYIIYYYTNDICIYMQRMAGRVNLWLTAFRGRYALLSIVRWGYASLPPQNRWEPAWIPFLPRCTARIGLIYFVHLSLWRWLQRFIYDVDAAMYSAFACPLPLSVGCDRSGDGYIREVCYKEQNK